MAEHLKKLVEQIIDTKGIDEQSKKVLITNILKDKSNKAIVLINQIPNINKYF